MSALCDAQLHLAKAEEFLTDAEVSRDLELFNAATSDAVVSGINSKDAVCLKLTGKTVKSDNHPAAVAELKKAGPAGATLAPTLQRLLKLKTRSQYQTMTIARQDATAAVDWARKLYEGARTIVQS